VERRKLDRLSQRPHMRTVGNILNSFSSDFTFHTFKTNPLCYTGKYDNEIEPVIAMMTSLKQKITNSLQGSKADLLAKKETKMKTCLPFALLAEFANLNFAIIQSDAAYEDARVLGAYFCKFQTGDRNVRFEFSQ
jgi:hypothetical protein